jgi:integrase
MSIAGSAEDTPKSHRVRSVPLSEQAVVALDVLSRREHFPAPDDLVFCSEVGGHLLDDGVRDAFYRALEDAELGHLRTKDDPIVFHDLRHTFGTLAIRHGARRPGHDHALRAAARQRRQADRGVHVRGRAPIRAPNRRHAPVTERY